MVSICCSPPDKRPGGLRPALFQPGEQFCHLGHIPGAGRAAAIRFSSTVSGAKQRRPSGTRPTPSRAILCDGSWRRSWPSNRSSPLEAASIPQIVLMVVDLPMPLRPISATTSPSPISRLTPNSACAGP